MAKFAPNEITESQRYNGKDPVHIIKSKEQVYCTPIFKMLVPFSKTYRKKKKQFILILLIIPIFNKKVGSLFNCSIMSLTMLLVTTQTILSHFAS